MSPESRRISSDSRGASMVFGLFFALFLVASVFRIHGILEAIWYRQHQQDAADAVTFAGAVMNARGMNLIALINMTMAVVLSVYVGLRLAQTLLIVAIGLCTALSVVTMGASMAYVPPLTSSSAQLQKTITKVGDKLPKILSALHTAGKAVSVVVPLGANTRVIQVATGEYDQKMALGIPGRLALPVEDGEFDDLCMHAGEFVGEVAFSPLSWLGAGKVRDALSDALGALAAAAPGWFCGENTDGKKPEKPDLDPKKKLDSFELPVLPTQKMCSDLSAKYLKETPSDEELEHLEAVCRAAAVEYMASVPSRTGEARYQEPLCPIDCNEEPRDTCPPAGVELCDEQRRAEIDQMAIESGQPLRVERGLHSPYGTRVVQAHKQCDPKVERKHPLRGTQWVERTVVRKYEWSVDSVQHGAHKMVAINIQSPTRLVVRKEDDGAIPCGDAGIVGPTYSSAPSKVCEGTPLCSDESGSPIPHINGPCPRVSPLKGGASLLYEATTEVIGILRCFEKRPHTKVETPDIDMSKELESKNKKKENTSPFQLESGVWLGGSDFQFRGVTFGGVPPSYGDKAVVVFSGQAPEPKSWRDTVTKVSRFAVSQAEYLFDLRVFSGYADQRDEAARLEWLWNQGWVARLRPFRLNHGSADGPRDKQRGIDLEQTKFAGGNGEPAQDLSSCKQDGCSKLSELLQ